MGTEAAVYPCVMFTKGHFNSLSAAAWAALYPNNTEVTL